MEKTCSTGRNSKCKGFEEGTFLIRSRIRKEARMQRYQHPAAYGAGGRTYSCPSSDPVQSSIPPQIWSGEAEMRSIGEDMKER